MIDWTRVDELRGDFGDEGFADVVAIFAEETGPVVERLATGCSADPLSDLHFVKGSAVNMGLTDLVAICRQGEGDLAAGVAPDLSGLRGAYQDACATLRHPAA